MEREKREERPGEKREEGQGGMRQNSSCIKSIILDGRVLDSHKFSGPANWRQELPRSSQKQSGAARELQERSESLEGVWERQHKGRTEERAENSRED